MQPTLTAIPQISQNIKYLKQCSQHGLDSGSEKVVWVALADVSLFQPDFQTASSSSSSSSSSASSSSSSSSKKLCGLLCADVSLFQPDFQTANQTKIAGTSKGLRSGSGCEDCSQTKSVCTFLFRNLARLTQIERSN